MGKGVTGGMNRTVSISGVEGMVGRLATGGTAGKARASGSEGAARGRLRGTDSWEW